MTDTTTAPSPTAPPRQRLGRILSIAIIAAAVITGLLVIDQTNNHPRTDDAEIFANFIGIAPQVDGPITQLPVKDNQFMNRRVALSNRSSPLRIQRCRRPSPIWTR